MRYDLLTTVMQVPLARNRRMPIAGRIDTRLWLKLALVKIFSNILYKGTLIHECFFGNIESITPVNITRPSLILLTRFTR